MREEPEGFREFVMSNERQLLRAAWLLTGDWHRAEDLVQTALAKVWSHWSGLANDNPAAYTRRVVFTTFASGHRRRWIGEIPTDPMPEHSDTAAIDTAVGARAEAAALLRSLPPRQRAVVVLRYFEDLPRRRQRRPWAARSAP